MKINPFAFAKSLLAYLKKEDISDREVQHIENTIHNNTSIENLINELEDKEKISEQISLIFSFDTKKALTKISKETNRNNRYLFLKIAAGLIILIASTIYLGMSYLTSNKYNVAEIGTGKTIFRSAAGDIINLDTLSNIKISEDILLQNNEGTLVVTANKNEEETDIAKVNILEVPYKGIYKIVLHDGTKVTLNSGSSLEFPSFFSAHQRIVKLKGEAFFDVQKDNSKSFIVKTDDMSIQVLGTKFNVKSYSNENNSYTTLAEGSIILSYNEGKQIISPGEQVVFNRQKNEISVIQVEAELFTAWTQNMFYFKDTSLDDIMKRLSRWYDLDIRYNDINVDAINTVYSGKVKMYDHPEDILRKFEKAGDLRFELGKNTIDIYKKQY